MAIYSKKLNVKESNDPASPLLAKCPGEMKACLCKTTCINVHSNTVHKSQKKKGGGDWKAHPLRNGGTDVEHRHKGINTTLPYKGTMHLTTGTNLLNLRC